MDNWKTVQIIGTCNASDVPALAKACHWDHEGGNLHCLSDVGSLDGLNDWPAEKIDRIGTLAERDYKVVDVANTLFWLSQFAPSLRLRVHCGGDDESRTVVATIVLNDGGVLILPPEIDELPERTEGSIMEGVQYALAAATARRR